MPTVIQKEFSLFLNSDENAGAENVSSDGSRFSVSLNTPIAIPSNAFNCSVAVIQASVWFTTPNISSSYKNNILSFTTSDIANAGTHVIDFSDGLYSLGNMNSYINVALTNLGLPASLINLTAFASTGQTIVNFLNSGDSIDFTVPNSCNVILGFDKRLVVATINNDSVYSDTVAQFNRVSNYLISSDLISSGIPINNKTIGLISSIPINVPAGDLITFSPTVPTEVDAENLVGTYESNINVQLLDQQLRPTATQSESYSVLIRIKYNILI